MNPIISIIICCYNSVDRLEPTLKAIEKQILDECAFEVIVVDNASKDGTGDFAVKICNGLFEENHYKVIHEQQPGLIHARKKGFSASSGDLIIFCDDDNHLDKNYFNRVIQLMQKNKQIGALGGIGSFDKHVLDSKPWCKYYCGMYAIGPQGQKEGPIHPPTLYGAGIIIRRDVLEQLFTGDFQSILTGREGTKLSSGEDTEISYLVRLLGYEVWYSPELKFYHAIPENRFEKSHFIKLSKGIGSAIEALVPYRLLWDKKVNAKTSSWIYQLSKRLFFMVYDYVFNPKKKMRSVELRMNIERLKVVLHRRGKLKRQIEYISKFIAKK